MAVRESEVKGMSAICNACKYEMRTPIELPCSVCKDHHQFVKKQDAGETDKTQRHKEICKEIHNTYERKNHDYGDSFGQSFRDYGPLAGLIRMEDKFNRLKTLVGGIEPQVSDESIRDTLKDLANYAIMTLLEMEG